MAHMEDFKGAALSKTLVVRSLLAYGVFGAVQVLYRLVWGFRASSRMRAALRDMPATKGAGHDAPVAGLLLRNFIFSYPSMGM